VGCRLDGCLVGDCNGWLQGFNVGCMLGSHVGYREGSRLDWDHVGIREGYGLGSTLGRTDGRGGRGRKKQ